jgi:hypothetical protein
MFEIYHLARSECVYHPTRYLQMLAEYGFLSTVQRLLAGEWPVKCDQHENLRVTRGHSTMAVELVLLQRPIRVKPA